MRTKIQRITTRQALQELARELGVRPDWHEPDELDLTASVQGMSFDNCGFWGENSTPNIGTEMYVTLYKNGIAIAHVNLATLFAFACGTYEG